MKHFIFIGFILSLANCYLPNLPPKPTPTPPVYDFGTNSSIIPIAPTPLPVRPGDPVSGGIQTRNQIFPYNLVFDTLAHMNCPADVNPGDPIFFSYKMGAYSRSGGLKFSNEFLQNTRNFNSAEKSRALKNSVFYNSRARLALSERGNPTVPMTFGENLGFQSTYSFSHPHAIESLLKNNVTQSLAYESRIELQVPIPGSVIHRFATTLGSSHILTLTYDNGANISPIAKGAHLYRGKNYTLSFTGGRNSKNFLSRVTEADLATNRKEGSWSCKKQLRLAIHRHPEIRNWLFNHRDNQANFKRLVEKKEFDSVESMREDECIERANHFPASDRKILQALLPPQSFIIGRSKKGRKPCIQPVDFRERCYTNQVVRVEFDDNECSDLDPIRKCPSYLSICIRR